MSDADVLLTPAETAALLRVHPSTLRRWRAEKRGPAYVRVGRGYRYWRSAVLTWLNEKPTAP
jgi:excisionase family DNA binding protein